MFREEDYVAQCIDYWYKPGLPSNVIAPTPVQKASALTAVHQAELQSCIRADACQFTIGN